MSCEVLGFAMLQLQLLEEKHGLSRRDFSCGNTCAADAESNVDECKTLSSALEEVQRKGTLIERLVLLENRVLQLSLEMDEGNTSKSSTSTVEVSEMTAKESELLSIPKRQDESPPTVTAPGLQLPPMTPPRESIGVREGSRQHKNKGKKKKVAKKWLALFRLTC
ncbi:UNVERIFIED_CONTAM: hypothetical protein Sangu_2505000 [Sesamum angustifolium]|uniref:Uncharacterized protein n=1 Tax=Sesamum angustifolium TaxID=2727405 RepID=A0AAW2K012_9LAMI